MYLCIDFGGQVGRICFQLPSPVGFLPQGRTPPTIHEVSTKPSVLENYPELILDATVVASFQKAMNDVSDAGVRHALQGGINAAIQALQKRAGNKVTITQEAS